MGIHEVNTTELAESFGLSPVQVTTYWHEGMPKLARGSWDLGACWKWRYARLAAELETEKQRTPNEFADRDLEDALLKRTQREIKEIELAQRRGEILDVSTVAKVIERAVGAFRSRVLSIPSKSAPRVIACADVAEAKAVLDADIHDALGELSRISSDLATLRELAQADVSDGDTASEVDDQRVGGQGKISQSRGKRRARKVAHRAS